MALGGMFRNAAAIYLHLVGPFRGKKSGASLARCLHQTVSALAPRALLLACLRAPGIWLGSGFKALHEPPLSGGLL